MAATDSTVLLLGETGSGKELFATQIHNLSLRRSRTSVRVNCAAIPATLDGERTVRPREGRVHRCARAADRTLRAGGSLDDLSRRDRRSAGGDPGQAAARARGAADRAAGEPEAHSRRRARDCRHTPRPRSSELPRAPFARTCSTGSTSSRFACRRCASASTTFRCSSGGSSRSSDGPSAGGSKPSHPRTSSRCSATLAGQHPRAPQRRRARDDCRHGAPADHSRAGGVECRRDAAAARS